MEIILQDAGHVSLRLVGNYVPFQSDVYDDTVMLVAAERKVELDTISFRPPGFTEGRWHPQSVPSPRIFDEQYSNVQTTKASGEPFDVRRVWSKARSMAAYTAFNLPSHPSREGANIRTDFNCCSGVIACLHAMGLSLDGLRGDAGTQYDFSQIGLDF